MSGQKTVKTVKTEKTVKTVKTVFLFGFFFSFENVARVVNYFCKSRFTNSPTYVRTENSKDSKDSKDRKNSKDSIFVWILFSFENVARVVNYFCKSRFTSSPTYVVTEKQ